MSSVQSPVTDQRPGLVKVLLGSPILGPVAALLLASIFFAVMSPRFLTGPNFSLILQQVMVVGVLAMIGAFAYSFQGFNGDFAIYFAALPVVAAVAFILLGPG